MEQPLEENGLLLDDAVLQELVGEIDFDPDGLKARYLAERDKRLRDDGNEQYIEVTGDFSDYVDDPYVERAVEMVSGTITMAHGQKLFMVAIHAIAAAWVSMPVTMRGLRPIRSESAPV